MPAALSPDAQTMHRSPARSWLLLPLLAALVAASLTARPAVAVVRAGVGEDTASLRRALESAVAEYPGVAGVSVRNLRTGEAVSIRGQEKFPTASLIKVSVLVALLEEVEAGRTRLDEPLSMTAEDRVGGSGVLRYLAPGLRLTAEDAAWLMITVSDNTATNLLIDRMGVARVWQKMDALGLPATRVYRKVFSPAESSPAPDSSARYGLGVTTPEEMTRLFALLHEGRAVSPALDSLALRVLRANQDADKLVRWLPEDVAVAHKSGYDERARNDCGILYSPAAPLALCVATRENRFESYAPDNPASLMIAEVAREVFRHYNPGVPLPAAPAR